MRLMTKGGFALLSCCPPPIPVFQAPQSVRHNGLIKTSLSACSSVYPGPALALTALLSDELIRDWSPQAFTTCHLKATVSCFGSQRTQGIGSSNEPFQGFAEIIKWHLNVKTIKTDFNHYCSCPNVEISKILQGHSRAQISAKASSPFFDYVQICKHNHYIWLDIFPKVLEFCQNNVVPSWSLIISALYLCISKSEIFTYVHIYLPYICENQETLYYLVHMYKSQCLDWSNVINTAACFQKTAVMKNCWFTRKKLLYGR